MAMNPRLMRPLAKTPPGTPASLLLRFNGADASTDFVDSSPNNLTVTAYGDAQISTAESKFGGASGCFDGTGDYLTVTAPAIGTSDFTLEAWVRLSSFADYRNFWETREDDGSTAGFVFGANSSGQLYVYTSSNFQLVGGSLSVDTWHHVALVRKAGAWSMYVDGVDTGATYTSSVNLSLSAARIGADWASLYFMDGYIDDLRLTTGLAVYTGPFIPPTQQLSAYATPVPVQREASLLLHFDGDDESTVFTDSSVNALTVTATGNAQISTAQSRWGGASLYLDGDGSYLSVDNSDGVLDFGTGDFTVEMWVRLDVVDNRPGDLFMGIVTAQASGGFDIQYADYLGAMWQGIGIGAHLVAWRANRPWVPVANQWYHLAVERSSGETRIFVDGSQIGEVFADTESLFYGSTANIGTGDGYFTGYIDDLRITKGLAVYDGDFVVPAAQLPASASPYTTYKPYGTFLFSECVSGDLVGTYADGVGGRYTEVISAGSC